MKIKLCKKICMATLLSLMIITLSINGIQCLSTPEPEKIITIPAVLPESIVAIAQSPIEKAADLQYKDILSLIREAVKLAGGLDELIQNNDSVVLKPNLVTTTDYTQGGWLGKPLTTEINGTTTDWRVTKAVVEIVRELNPDGKVYVMEGSSNPTRKTFEYFKYTHEYIPGVDAFISLEEDSGGWQEFSSDKLVKVTLPQGIYEKTLYMNRIYKEADVLINLPCLKNHWYAVISGSIKNVGIGATPANIYGIADKSPNRNNMVNHALVDLHHWIHDFYMARPSDFVIMDGLQGIQNGPTPSKRIGKTTDIAQDQMNMRLIIAGKDALAVDTIASLSMGWDPTSVKYLTLLNKDGVGNLDTAAITVKGKRVDEVRKQFKGPTNYFSSGGAQITDITSPIMKIKKITGDGGLLHVQCKADSTVRKIEVYVDNTLTGTPVTSSFEDITIELDNTVAQGTVTVIGYDYFLNPTIVTKTLK